MNEILTVVSASRSIWLVRAPLRVAIMLVVGVLFAMSWAITMFGAPSGPYGRGGKGGKGKDGKGKGGKGKGGDPVLVPGSMMIKTRCQMPLRAAELFLNAHQGEPASALWTIELRTCEEGTGAYIPQLLRTITARSGSVDVANGEVPATAPVMEVMIEFETASGQTVQESESFGQRPVFLVNALATQHLLGQQAGPDDFGTPDQMIGQRFQFITPNPAPHDDTFTITDCLVVSDGVFSAMQGLCRMAIKRGF